ncbi:UPF0667 protein C1orf55 like protein [Gryllus bimaculatus]|nr:UPF0667 protein C1orf55 like protein [Gryllus bimaculatus]
MSVWVYLDKLRLQLEGPVVLRDLKIELLGENAHHIYFTNNGRKLAENAIIKEGVVRAYSRVLGGKGGFGSMLRAIGAQIEKTTNREACRDLSGRRLRDINEEKRLKNWIAQQAEREREAAEKRKKKLERLCFEPKHDFSDQNYEKARTELTEKVHDAVEQGFRSASTSTCTTESKRKLESQGGSQVKKKKSCLWVDDFDEDDISSNDSDSDEIQVDNKQNLKNFVEESKLKEEKDTEDNLYNCSQELKEKLKQEGNCAEHENPRNKEVSSCDKSEKTSPTSEASLSPESDKSDVCCDSSTSERDSGIASNASC